MRKFLIKILGGVPYDEYWEKIQEVRDVRRDAQHVLHLCRNQSEKIPGLFRSERFQQRIYPALPPEAVGAIGEQLSQRLTERRF